LHLARRGPQPEDVGPEQHAGRGAACRVHEVAVRRAVRRRHGDFAVGDGDRVGYLRQHQRDAGADQDAELPPSDEPAGFIFPSILFKLILLAHSCSFRA
jgi:hypothetical protein